MTRNQGEKALLLFAAIGLIPIALGYGFMPEKTLTPLFGIDVDNINLKHIMRAVMCLYFGQSVIWFLGATNEKMRLPALYCMVVFMLGLLAGRFLSLIIDGIPHWLLIVYIFLELSLGLIGLNLIMKRSKAG